MSENFDLELNTIKTVLFKFELNRTQSMITLIISLIGIFILPLILASEIFVNLFQNIFVAIPSYFSDPEHYAELYLFNNLAPNITRMIIFSVFLYLSIYALKKLLSNEKLIKINKDKIISQNRIVNWFGFKLSHGQAFFIFSLALVSLFFIVQKIIEFKASFMNEFDWELCFIPSGPYSASSHVILLDNIPLALYSLFIFFCLYSIFATRRRKKSFSQKQKIASIFSILVFIASLIIFSMYLMRLFCHLFMYTNLASIIGLSPESTNAYQQNDFINVLALLIGSLFFMIISHFFKRRAKNHITENQYITWFHIRLTEHRYILLLSYTLLFYSFFSHFFLTSFFYFGATFFYIDQIIMIVVMVIIFLYTLNKVNNGKIFRKIINSINNSNNFERNWFKYRIDRLYSIILFAISSGSTMLYVFLMISFNFSIRSTVLNPDFFGYSIIFFISIVLMIASLSFLLIFALYTIKHTINAIKSR